MAVILPVDYHKIIQSRLGVDDTELTNEDMDNSMYIEIAEATIMRRVPDYASVIDVLDLLNLRNACLAYACALFCPTMTRRVNNEVATFDVKWKKANTDWKALEARFLGDYENSLDAITTVAVSTIDYSGSLVDFIRNTRNPIGGEG